MGSSKKMPFQVRLEPEEGEALKKLVERRAGAIAAVGGTSSASAILRAIVIPVLIEEGLLPKPVAPADAPVAEPKRAAGRSARR